MAGEETPAYKRVHITAITVNTIFIILMQNETNCLCEWEHLLAFYGTNTKPKLDLCSWDAEGSGTPNSGTDSTDDRKNLNE